MIPPIFNILEAVTNELTLLNMFPERSWKKNYYANVHSIKHLYKKHKNCFDDNYILTLSTEVDPFIYIRDIDFRLNHYES